MKLVELRLENFRQFKGRQSIQFATDSDRNVTLVWAANGAGKTTLLNALTWVLYRKLSQDFEQPEVIYNRSSWSSLQSGERLNVRVELDFEDDGNSYSMSRESRFLRTESGDSIVEIDGRSELERRDVTGRSARPGNPDDYVKSILPERLHGFFFFNGERIEHLVQPSAYEEIGDAVKTVLGLEIVDRAMRHLKDAQKRFASSLKELGNEEEREVTEKIESIDAQIADNEETAAQMMRDMAHIDGEIEAASECLRGSEQARSMQLERDRLVKEQSAQRESLDKLEFALDQCIADRGFLAFGSDLFAWTQAQFQEKRAQKELPAPLKQDFIDDLLQDGVCICGAPLHHGSDGREHIEAWRKRAGLADVEERWMMVHAQAKMLTKTREQLQHDLEKLLSEQANGQDNLRYIGEKLSEVGAQLSSNSLKEIAELESQRSAHEKTKADLLRRQGGIENEVKRLREERAELEAKRRKINSGLAKAEQAKRRADAAGGAVEVFKSIYEIRTREIRGELEERIQQIYRRIVFKDYEPILSETFQLGLMNRATGMPAAKGTGENQILSLSFVGGLAAIARERYEQTKEQTAVGSGLRGGIFPIVMDAAFGSLDENYRRDVALALPKLADQIVIFVSKAGGHGVIPHLETRVGRSHVIHYLTPREDAVTEGIEIRGTMFNYVSPSADGAEYAEILGVS